MSKTNDELTVFVKATKNLNLHIATRNRAVTKKVKRKIQLMMGKLGDTNKILIQVPYSQELMKKVKTIHGSRWNPGEKYWEVPYNDDIISKLQNSFGETLVIDPSFYFLSLQKELSIRKYSRKTTKAYIRYNHHFLQFIGKNPEKIGDPDIKKYLYYIVERKEVSASTLNIVINALKFHYGEILKRRFVYEIERPKKDKKLPVVLSKEEVMKILTASSNIKHRAILMLIY